MNVWLLSGAGIMAFICLLHTFAGGREIAKPLLAARMDRMAQDISYYCWHLVTLTLAALSGAFLWAGLDPNQIGLAFLATALSGAFAVWGFALWSMRGNGHLQGALFAMATLVGGAGLVA